MDYYADVGVQILFLIMLAASFNVLFGYAGQVSMAHAVFYGLGAYTGARLMIPAASGSGVIGGLGWPLVPAVLVAAVAAFVVALLLALPALSRVTGQYLILMTLAFQVVGNQLMQTLSGLTGGAYGLSSIPSLQFFGSPLSQPSQAFWFVLGATVIVLLICFRIGESPLGRLLRGIRENEVAVRALGKDNVLPKLVAFGVAGAIAGGAGVLNAAYYQFITPNTFNLDLSILVVSIVVLGGSGNLLGTVIAAVVLGSLRPTIQRIGGDQAIVWQAVIYGLALILVMRFRPQGLLPEGVGLGWMKRAVPGFRKTPPDRRQERVSDSAEAQIELGISSRINNDAHPNVRVLSDSPPVPVLEVRGLSKRFGGVHAVQDVDFELPAGIVTGLLGPNGAGKTTVFNLITNTVHPDAGSVTLRGRDIGALSTVKIAQLGMARSFQDGRLFTRLSALDNVAIAVPNQPGEHLSGLIARPLASVKRERHVRASALEALGFVGLADKSNVLVENLSFGEQKLVAIARLLATECDVLLLDEPTSGVDPSAVEHVIGVVRDLSRVGKTVCLVEHSVHMMSQLADRALFMDQGRVIGEGTLDELMGKRELTEIYFGT